MFYTPTNELILKSNGTDLSGSPTEVEKWVSAQKKEDVLDKLHDKFKEIVDSTDLPVPSVRSPFTDNFFEEVLNHVPMWCNMLTQRGVKRVLFTGHLNVNRDDWILRDEHTQATGYNLIIDPRPTNTGHFVIQDIFNFNNKVLFLHSHTYIERRSMMPHTPIHTLLNCTYIDHLKFPLNVDKDKLKYDIIITPNAVTKLVKIKYNGLDKIRLEGGNLYATTTVNMIKESQPFAYQIINGNQVEV